VKYETVEQKLKIANEEVKMRKWEIIFFYLILVGQEESENAGICRKILAKIRIAISKWLFLVVAS
jgi:hypothetical protein